MAKFINLAVLLLFILLLTLLLFKARDIRSNVVTIGAVLPLTGSNAHYGIEIKNAIELAREEINQVNGIHGRSLEIIYEDDQADPKVGVSAVQKLISIDKVPIILGSWVSSVALATAPLAEQAKVIMMAEAIAPSISEAGDYIFRIQPSATFYSSELIKFLSAKFNLKTLSIIYCNNEFGVALKKTVEEEAKKFGISILNQEAYLPGNQDFRGHLLKIKVQNPEALFIAGYQEQFLIIKQARELGIESRILAGPPFENKQLITDLGELAEGVIYPYHFYSAVDRPSTQRYLKAYKEKFGVESGGFAPLMYDAVRILASALEKCETNTDCIKDFLYSLSYEGVSGTIKFDSNGDPIIPIVIKTVRNGDFVKLD